MSQSSKQNTKAVSLTRLAAFAIWVSVAVWMILTAAPGRAWWAWGVSVILVLIITAVVNQITTPRPAEPRDGYVSILDTTERDLAEVEQIQNNIKPRFGEMKENE